MSYAHKRRMSRETREHLVIVAALVVCNIGLCYSAYVLFLK
jgi:hypothetical protein